MKDTAAREGIIVALLTFGFWGVAPIYFKWLAHVSAYEIIAHRIIWSVFLIAGFLLLRDGPRFWKRLKLPPRTLLMLALSGTLVATNWLIFVWAVANDRVLATSLGYFINPLVNVLLGMLFLGERLTTARWAAVILAGMGTLYLGVSLGQAPWVALCLAFSFGFYGLLRKQLSPGPMVGLFWETTLLSVPALVIVLGGISSLTLQFGVTDMRTDSLLILSGLVTILPLIGFNFAAKRLSLTVVGFFQYLAPTISFLLAVFLFGEVFTSAHVIAFSCIWLALLIFSLEPLLMKRRRR